MQAGLGIAAIPGDGGEAGPGWSVFSIEGDSFRDPDGGPPSALPVSVAVDHFFQVIRQDPERVKQGV